MAKCTQFFSLLEKSLLTELVRKHKDLVENKKNNYKTTQQKNKSWEALSEQFNSPPGAMELHKTVILFVALSLRLILSLKLQAQSSNMQLPQA